MIFRVISWIAFRRQTHDPRNHELHEKKSVKPIERHYSLTVTVQKLKTKIEKSLTLCTRIYRFIFLSAEGG